MSPLNKKVLAEEFSLEDVYNTYITSNEKNVEQFKNDSSDIYKEIEDKMMDDKDEEYLRKLLLVASFTHMSNLFRRAAEKIVDEIEE